MTPPVSHAGFHGKLPVLGDFAWRRLPHGVVDAWDACASAGLEAIARRGGSAWRDTFLSMRPWRMAIGAGVCDRDAWVGVVAPSHDRVGRAFPLLLAARVPGLRGSVPCVPPGAWFDQAQAALREAMAGAPLFAFDLAVTALPDPSMQCAPLSPWSMHDAGSLCWRGGEPRDGYMARGLPGVPEWLRLAGMTPEEAVA